MTHRIATLTLALFLGALGVTACTQPFQTALPAPEVPAAPAEAPHDHRTHAHFDAAAGFVDGEARVSFQKEVVPILRLHCGGCHSAGGPAASALTMFDTAGVPQHGAIQGHVGHIILEVQTGRMPAGKPYSVPDADFRLLDVWAASGAPDN